MTDPQLPPAGELPVAPSEVLLGKYRVDRVIGVGGMGIVAEAWHLDFEEKVAIKFLLPSLVDSAEAVGRFEREARVLFKIKSENVCRVIDVGKLANGVPFMVMEHLEGYDLATRLEQREPISVERAVEYGLQACQALANAHVRGIVHRDLKPENLFIARDATGEMALKLLDFGLSKERDEDEPKRQRKLTAREQVMGTPHYMSPEQWVASTAVGPATDQWALAAIVFEMLTGKPPFDGKQLANICSAIMNAPTPSLTQRRPDAPPGLDAVLHKALEKNPNDRYANVGAFAVALGAFAPPGLAAKAERTRKMLERSTYDEEDVSGEWKNLRSPQAPSDMAATMRKFEVFERVRSITSTSWQRMHWQQASSKAAVAAAVVVMLLVAWAAVTALRQSSAPDVPATGTEPTEVRPEVVAAPPSESSPVEPPAVSAESAPDASATASARAKPPSRPTSPHGQPKPSRKPDIFDDR